MESKKNFRWILVGSRKMRKYKGQLQILFSRVPYLKSTLKVVFVFIVVVSVLLYMQEKHVKETSIALALKSRVTDEVVRLDNDTLLLDGLSNGKNSSEEGRVRNAFVVIGVTSLPENVDRRNIIRRTWAKNAHEHGTIVLFFIGRPIFDDMMGKLIPEAYKYNDLIIDDFEESYYALSIKTLRLMKYFKFHHPKSKFLVKTDDDVFVSVPNLVQYCYSINKRFDEENVKVNDGGTIDRVRPDYFIGGMIHYDRGPHTWNPFSKWYAPPDVWRSVYDRAVEENKKRGRSTTMCEDSYPAYAEGNFYVMSSDAVYDILNVSQTVPLYHLEDVYVTGVLATWILKIEKSNIPYISSSSNFFPKLSYFFYKLFTADAKDVIAFHCDNYVELISVIYKESIQ